MLRSKFIRSEKITRQHNNDIYLGDFKIPKGKITHLYGDVGSGKTQLAQRAVSKCQKSGGKVCYLDVANSTTPERLLRNGCVPGDLLYYTNSNTSEIHNILTEMIKHGDIDLIVIDEISNIVVNDSGFAALSGFMNRILGAISGNLNKTSLLLLNTCRPSISLGSRNTEVTYGGNMVNTYSSLVLKLSDKGIECIKSRDALLI